MDHNDTVMKKNPDLLIRFFQGFNCKNCMIIYLWSMTTKQYNYHATREPAWNMWIFLQPTFHELEAAMKPIIASLQVKVTIRMVQW